MACERQCILGMLPFMSASLSVRWGPVAYGVDAGLAPIFRQHAAGCTLPAFEPEVTAKIAKKDLRIYEVGISYFGRKYVDGKKITWKDGFSAIRCIFKYNIFN